MTSIFSKDIYDMQQDHVTPFRIRLPNHLRWLASAGEQMLGLRALDSYYQKRQRGMDCKTFLRYTLETLNVDYRLATGNIDMIPEQGATVVVANHPFGAIEGVVLAELLLKRRSDVKILANQFLHRIDELSELFIGVDVIDNSSRTAKANTLGVRQAIDHLRQDGLLLVFPAGEVSSLNFQSKQITDREWNRIIGMLVRKTLATTVPVYIEGKNSPLFQFVGVVHPRLRTLLLAREMLNKRRKTMVMHVGEAIAYSELKHLPSNDAITQYLRLNTYLLASRAENKRAIRKSNSARPMHTIADAMAIDKLQADIELLSDERLMLNTDQFAVYCAPANELPHVLPEIGRLREITFRAVGEGTGLLRDIDDYDQDYLHLFIWNREKLEIAGAYRLGLTDVLLQKKGTKGLYSRSLFNYKKSFVQGLGTSIEMGRSFICADYQRNLNSLLLLWKGIAGFVSRNPQYTTLFGPVSISSDYSELSRSLMASFLEIHHYDGSRADQVKPTNPQKKPRKMFWTRNMLAELEDSQLISKLIYRMEGDKGLPVLIRQYLSLKGRLVCFNVDRDFNNALDGLIIVDLPKVEERVLGRYMGKVEAASYLAHHNHAPVAMDEQEAA
ncbi:MAG: lysophospholipid acyltransferase family protein [Gammaproteobacteria bacterium]|nr:MAG: lysophospholipid acyltransferase family protein [Gammaproteobacteria bacterium]